jgi:hypothetical protein
MMRKVMLVVLWASLLVVSVASVALADGNIPEPRVNAGLTK